MKKTIAKRKCPKRQVLAALDLINERVDSGRPSDFERTRAVRTRRKLTWFRNQLDSWNMLVSAVLRKRRPVPLTEEEIDFLAMATLSRRLAANRGAVSLDRAQSGTMAYALSKRSLT